MRLVVDMYLLCTRLVLLFHSLGHTPGLLAHFKVVVPEESLICPPAPVLLDVIVLSCLDRT